jgi:hypothetical protein
MPVIGTLNWRGQIVKPSWSGNKAKDWLEKGKAAENGEGETPEEGGRAENHNRHPVMAVRLEWPNRNGYSVLYGNLLGGFLFDPSKGVQFLIEAAFTQQWDAWAYGVWKVSVTGSELEGVWHHLSQSKEIFIRAGEERRIAVDGPLELRGYNDRRREE